MLRTYLNKFNRGEVDPNALARQDVNKVQHSSARMENFMPIRLGPMQYRPGTQYIGDIGANQAYMLPFVARTTDTALLEFTDNQLRVWVNDAVVTRTARTAAFTNGTFNSDITGWTDDSSGSGTSAWKTGGYAELTGDGSSPGAFYQSVTITETNEEHGVHILIENAPVVLNIGTTVGGGEIFSGTLDPGEHSFAFTPATSPVTFHFSNKQKYSTLIDSVAIEGTGAMTFTTNIPDACLSKIRHTQSADVLYLAAADVEQYVVKRRGTKSWSYVPLRSDKGPFEAINGTPITMTAGALNGDTTLTASDDFFKAGHVGALFKVASTSQQVTASVTAADNGTNAIRVAGVGNVRIFKVIVTGTWTATVTLQRSTDELNWEDIESYTVNQNKNYDDGLDNSVLFYRLHVKSGDYTSGTVELKLDYASGSIEGICRVTGYTSATVVDIQVLEDFGSTDASKDWYEGSWSGVKGYPSAVELYEGRLWYAGKTRVWGSVSDAFTSFGGDEEGDSKAIQKTIGFGPVDDVYWLAPTSRLIMGLATDEVSVRSSSFGEVLTQENANLKAGTNQGSADTSPVRADSTVYFVQRSKIKLYGLDYSLESDTHTGTDATTLTPGMLYPGVARLAVSRQPETRIFCVLENGEVRVLLREQAEQVEAWSRITTVSGTITDVVVLPGEIEDEVYFVTLRGTTYYLEKMARQRDALGQNDSKHLDAFVAYTSPGTTVTGLDHLDTETVHIWGDGEDQGTAVVSSGQITIPAGLTDVVVGLQYTATCISNRISAYVEEPPFGRYKRIVRIGFTMKDVILPAITFGESETELDAFPQIEQGQQVIGTVVADYDHYSISFNGAYETDPRVVVKTTAPATVMAWVLEVDDPEHTASSG